MKLKYRVIERFRGKYSVEAMCEVFEVSRSGYYAWRKRQGREAKDQWLVDLIAQCQQICKQTYGIREVERFGRNSPVDCFWKISRPEHRNSWNSCFGAQ